MNIPKSDSIFIHGKKACNIRWTKKEQELALEIKYTQEWIDTGFALDFELPLCKCTYFLNPKYREYYGFIKDMVPYHYEDIHHFHKSFKDSANYGAIEYMYAMPPEIRQGAIDFESDKRKNHGYIIPTLNDLRHVVQGWRKSGKINDFRFKDIFMTDFDQKFYIHDNSNIYQVNMPHDIYDCNDDMNSRLIEQVTLDMAKDCDISVAETRLIKIPGVEHHFLFSKRFDRNGISGQKRHFATAETLCGSDWDNGYHKIARFIRKKGHPKDLEELWRRLLFNVLVSNTDDRMENFGFLRISGKWRLAPSYDIEPSYDTSMSHNILLDNRGSYRATGEDIVALAPEYMVLQHDAEKTLEKMRDIIFQWEKYADKYKANDIDKKYLETCLNREQEKQTMAM